MFSLLGLVMLGFVLGMRHATDADHVIAVTTIVSRHRTIRGAGLIGMAWGVGHTITIVLVGGAIILLGWVVPPRVELFMELAVAAMLVVLGLTNLRSVHRHGDYVHTHRHGAEDVPHAHEPDATPLGWLDRRFGRLQSYQLTRPLFVGIVHGLAGSAAATLLVLTVIQQPQWAVVYLVLFGAGTIGGMMLMTVLLAVPFAMTGGRAAGAHHWLRLGASATSIGFGLFLAYQVGIVDGLFLP